MDFRHEYKFILTYSEYIMLCQRLRVLMQHDENVDELGEYKIKSLYFDNLYDKALYEKINGVDNREKFRIRYYNDDFGFINLEKKSKINNMCNKVSVRITKEECLRILNNDLSWMLGCEDRQLLQELYVKMKIQLLRPKVIVQYIREPFVYKHGNIRVTLDRNIKTSLNSVDMFDLDAPMVVAGEDTVLVEVKYDEYLPDIIRQAIGLNSEMLTPYSKYAACRVYDL